MRGKKFGLKGFCTRHYKEIEIGLLRIAEKEIFADFTAQNFADFNATFNGADVLVGDTLKTDAEGLKGVVADRLFFGAVFLSAGIDRFIGKNRVFQRGSTSIHFIYSPPNGRDNVIFCHKRKNDLGNEEYCRLRQTGVHLGEKRKARNTRKPEGIEKKCAEHLFNKHHRHRGKDEKAVFLAGGKKSQKAVEGARDGRRQGDAEVGRAVGNEYGGNKVSETSAGRTPKRAVKHTAYHNRHKSKADFRVCRHNGKKAVKENGDRNEQSGRGDLYKGCCFFVHKKFLLPHYLQRGENLPDCLAGCEKLTAEKIRSSAEQLPVSTALYANFSTLTE